MSVVAWVAVVYVAVAVPAGLAIAWWIGQQDPRRRR